MPILVQHDPSLGSGGPVIDPESGLVTDYGFAAAVYMSLFLDARSDADEGGGWWAEKLTRPIGSLLWTLRTKKVTLETMRLAKLYTESALEWMIEDQIAAMGQLAG